MKPRRMKRPVWRLLYRLRRVKARADAARGECMNLRWVNLFFRWGEVFDELRAEIRRQRKGAVR